MTLDEFAESLNRVYGPIIREADDFRPLAQYINSLLEKQREACAAEAAGVSCHGHGMDADEEGTREACVDSVRATPLVTEANENVQE